MKVIQFFTLLIVPLLGYCQNTTLTPTISEHGYCYDSLQIREVARLTKVTKTQKAIINHQDSLITDLNTVVSNCDSIQTKQDSIISNQSTIIENKDKTIEQTEKYYQNELKHQKKKVKRLTLIIVVKAVFIVFISALSISN